MFTFSCAKLYLIQYHLWHWIRHGHLNINGFALRHMMDMCCSTSFGVHFVPQVNFPTTCFMFVTSSSIFIYIT